MSKAQIAGVGMVKFAKPGRSDPYRVMAAQAIREAMADAGVSADQIQQAHASFLYASTGAGQHAVYDVFQTGIPVFNHNNACASGSSALIMARQAVQSGEVDCALAFGFDEMPAGAIEAALPNEFPGQRIDAVLDAQGYERGMMTPRWFGAAGQQYMEKYGAGPELFAKIAVKSRRHAARNPFALFTDPLEVEDVLQAKPIFGGYLTRLMACPPTCGAAAAIVVSADFAKRHGISKGVEILGQALATDTEDSWTDAIQAAGAGNTRRAAEQAYARAGVGPEDIDVVELHDCFTTNEAISYEGLGLCGEGQASAFVDAGDNTYGGKVVVNPSGGLMSKGHPIGATGLAQCCELVWQLRGEAGARQVPDAKLALQHNIGLVAAAAVTIYALAGN